MRSTRNSRGELLPYGTGSGLGARTLAQARTGIKPYVNNLDVEARSLHACGSVRNESCHAARSDPTSNGTALDNELVNWQISNMAKDAPRRGVGAPPSTLASAGVLKALANVKRLEILNWLRDPRAHFPPQVDGDLVTDGVC